MTQLSEHFSQVEFERDAALPAECVGIYTMLCERVLEPIRAYVGPLLITSGYRPPEANAAAHGVPNSQHIATAAYCAADFEAVNSHDLRHIFDWIRLKSGLPCDQMILEHQLNGGPDIIHVSYVVEGPRREALEGSTANQSAYVRASYNDPQQAQDYQWTA